MIYFDSGATTLEKPRTVWQAMARAVNTMSSPGRGSHQATQLAEETDYACRAAAAKLFGVADESNVIFTGNATHGLNIAIHTLVQPGSRVVICNHVSNVFGCVQPVEEMAALCVEAGVPFLLDASQSAGILPVRMDTLHAAFIAMPGHKGLYGPQGTGLLLCNHEAAPLLYGGTGSLSKLQTMPDMLPDRLESGTHNMPGIAGLLEGIRYVQRTGVETIAAHERRLTAQAVALLRQTEGIRLFWRDGLRHQTGVLSFVVEGVDCEELGEALARQGIALRAGLHCAPLAHRTVGTLKTGTVRFSPSAFNTSQQVVQFAQILQRTIRKM